MRSRARGLLFAGLLSGSASASAVSGTHESSSALLATADGGTAARLEAVSAPLLGSPYRHSPLGEGEGVDPDPRLRFDAFDCLTFVETAMALAAARAPEDVTPLLDDLRYGDARRSFEARNHFVEAQWVPRNLEKGWLRPAAAAIAGPHVTTASKGFGPALFAKRAHPERLPLAAESVPAGTFALDIVPLDVARAHLDRFGTGQLVFVVRTDAKRQPSRVTHAGLIVATPRGPVLRHASRDPFRRVVDEPLARFLARNASYDLWPVVGLAVYEIQVPKERVKRLTGRPGG
jgi:hypothetical protein